MRLNSWAFAGALVLTTLANGCGTPDDQANLTTGNAAKTTTTERPAICADIEQVTGLAAEIATAVNADNLTNLRQAITNATDHADEAAQNPPQDLETVLADITDTLQAADAHLDEADPTSIDAPAVAETLENLQALFQDNGMLLLAQHQQHECA